MQEFTETFEEFLNNKSGNWLVNKLADIPSFKFKDEELNIDYTLLFSNLIKNKYLLREIGAETEEMFEYYFDRKIDEIKIKYVPKVSMWINNFNDLFKFTVRLNLERNYSSGDINTYYLNPANKLNPTKTINKDGTVTYSGNLKTENVDDTITQGHSTLDRDVLQTVWGKTRANILDQIFELKDIYYEMIESFNNIFMGLY